LPIKKDAQEKSSLIDEMSATNRKVELALRVRTELTGNPPKYLAQYFSSGEWHTCMLNSMYPMQFRSAEDALSYALDIVAADQTKK